MLPVNSPAKDKLKIKAEILNAAIRKQQSLIDDYKARINDLRESVDSIYEDEEDLQEYSVGNEFNDKINRLADQLQFANEEMRILDRMRIGDEPNEEVALGSVVVTDERTFFISVSLERFYVDGHTYFGISTKSPLFEEMEGKRKGDRFMFNADTYAILDIF